MVALRNLSAPQLSAGPLGAVVIPHELEANVYCSYIMKLTLLYIILLLIGGCKIPSTRDNKSQSQNLITDSVSIPVLQTDSLRDSSKIEDKEDYKPINKMPFFARITHKDRPHDLTDFYVDTGTGPALFVTIKDLYTDHYYNHEYRNNTLFVIRRIGYHRDIKKLDTNWTDELWKYDRSGNSKMLFRAGGVDFRFNIPGTIAAIDARSSIWFIDDNGTILKQIPFSDIENDISSVSPFAWSEDSNIFFIATDSNNDYWIRISDWRVGRCSTIFYAPYGGPD